MARAVDGRPQIASIAVKGGGTREEMVQLMQVGVRDVLVSFTARDLRQAAARASAKLASAEDALGDLFAFMPAKPGCGASTIATYATAIASQKSQEPTLLLDFDIRLGVTSFLLKAEGIHTITDALLQADQHGSGFMVEPGGAARESAPAGVGAGGLLPPGSRRSLCDSFGLCDPALFAGLVDLPGTMEDCETETLMRAKRIFLVCTPDIGALHVARRKASWLQDLRLDR